MSSYKTHIEQNDVENFLEEHLRIERPALEYIDNGEISQAFFFDSPEGERVLRINARNAGGFSKDAFAEEHFGSPQLPIPKILEVGDFAKGIKFAISERVTGKTLDNFHGEALDSLVPIVITTLDTIHAIPPAGEGFGRWDINGKGKYTTWRDTLIAMRDDRKNDDAITASFDEPGYRDEIRSVITTLLDDCPEERSLIHADYGFGNVLSDGRVITGVIDWQGSMYGDPLYDVAWLDFWDEDRGYFEKFKEHYATQGHIPKNFEARIACYQLLIGVQCLSFFAKSDQIEKYDYTKSRTAKVCKRI